MRERAGSPPERERQQLAASALEAADCGVLTCAGGAQVINRLTETTTSVTEWDCTTHTDLHHHTHHHTTGVVVPWSAGCVVVVVVVDAVDVVVVL